MKEGCSCVAGELSFTNYLPQSRAPFTFFSVTLMPDVVAELRVLCKFAIAKIGVPDCASMKFLQGTT